MWLPNVDWLAVPGSTGDVDCWVGDILIVRSSPWPVEFGSLSHYLRQFLCTQVVVSRKKLSCIRTSHTSALAASVSSPHAVYSRSLPGRLSRRVEITVKSQITGPVVGLSDDLFSVEKVTLKTSHHNFHPLGDFHWSKTSPQRSQKIPEYILKKKVRPNYQVGKKTGVTILLTQTMNYKGNHSEITKKKTASCLIPKNIGNFEWPLKNESWWHCPDEES